MLLSELGNFYYKNYKVDSHIAFNSLRIVVTKALIYGFKLVKLQYHYNTTTTTTTPTIQ